MRGTLKATRLGSPVPPEAPQEEGRTMKNTSKHYELSRRICQGAGWLYAIEFNPLDMGYSDTFACAGGREVSIYQCLEQGEIVKLQTYSEIKQPLSPDGIRDLNEEFCALAWAVSKDGMPMVVVAGKHAVIRVIDCGTESLSMSLIGHGGPINDLRTQSSNPFLVASASKDESVRLWNVHTGVCILILAGAHGHRHDVVSVDFHPFNKFLVASGGYDHTVRIWSLEEFWEYIELSQTWTGHASEFPTKFIQYPIFTAAPHSNYVDCVRWLGDLILSKAPEDSILLWEPIYKNKEHDAGAFDVLHAYLLDHCEIWFVKFSFDITGGVLACGNEKGELLVWDLRSTPPVLLGRLTHPKCDYPIRQTATSWDGKTIVCCCDNGTIWRWDLSTDNPTPLDKKRRKIIQNE